MKTAIFLFNPTHIDYSDAHCKGIPTDMFMERDFHHDAQRVCRAGNGCPKLVDCYFEAVRDNMYGTWGGTWFSDKMRMNSRDAKSMFRYARAELVYRMDTTLPEFIERYGDGLPGLRRALQGKPLIRRINV